MARLFWGRLKNRTYEKGVDRGVLYPRNNDGEYGTGVAWNGLTGVTENHTGGEPTPFFADNVKYLNLLSVEQFGCTIEAFTYPEEFQPCLGRVYIADGVTATQQRRRDFAFSYRTVVGNAVDPDYSYKVHLVYGCSASRTDRQRQTINKSSEPLKMSWEVTTLPIVVKGFKPTAEFIFDGPTFKKLGIMNILHAIEDILYGDETHDPRVPTPEEIRDIYAYERYLRDSNGIILYEAGGEPLIATIYD